MENNNPQERNILVPNDIADKTVYANTMMATHSREEFTLDFIQTLPGLHGPTVYRVAGTYHPRQGRTAQVLKTLFFL